MDELLCPNCNERSLVKASILASAGTANISSSTMYAPMVTSYTTSQSKSDLAKLIGPPQNKSAAAEGCLMWGMFVIFLVIGIAIFPLLIIPAIIAAIMVPRMKRQKEILRQQYAIYERLYFCPRCGTGVDHERRYAVPMRDFKKLYS